MKAVMAAHFRTVFGILCFSDWNSYKAM